MKPVAALLIAAALFSASSAHAELDCAALKKAVAQYGLATVQGFAKSMGYTDAEMQYAIRKCLPPKQK